MKHFRIIGADGTPYYTSRTVEEPHPKGHNGKPKPIEVPRLPEDFEDWDEVQGKFVKDHPGAADHKAGVVAIAAAHASKILEARLFVKGVEVDGYLSAEAAALNIPIAELVDSVIQKAEAALASEVQRRIEKSKGVK